jgi:hypothetical protein
MKRIKSFKLFESLEVREEWIKSVHDNVNWDLVEDIKDKAVDYLDQGKSLRILIGRATETLCTIHHSRNSDSVNYLYDDGISRLVTEKDRIFYSLSIFRQVELENGDIGVYRDTLDTLEFCDEVKRMVKPVYPEEENNVGR